MNFRFHKPLGDAAPDDATATHQERDLPDVLLVVVTSGRNAFIGEQ